MRGRDLVFMFTFICGAIIATAQDCYTNFLSQGKDAFDQLEFDEAVKFFKAARICPNNSQAQLTEVNEWIDKANSGIIDAIEKARDAALRSEEQALQAQAKAEQQALLSEANRLAYLANQELEKGNLEDALPLAFLALEMTENDALPFVKQVFGNVVAEHSVMMAGPESGVLESGFLSDELIWCRTGHGTVDIWDSKGTLHSVLSIPNDRIRIVESAGQNRIVTGTDAGVITLWTELVISENGKMNHQRIKLDSHDDAIYDLNYSENSSMLTSAGRDGSVKLWTITGQKLVREIDKKEAPQLETIFIGGDSRIVARSDKTLRFYALGGEIQVEIKDEKPFYAPVISSDGQSILAFSGSGNLKVLDGQGNPITEIFSERAIQKASFLPNGNIFMATASGKVMVWNRTGDLIKSTEGHRGTVRGIVLSPDQQIISSFSDNGTLKTWNKDGEPLMSISQLTDLTSACFSPDSKSILTSGSGSVNLWDLEGNLLMRIEDFKGMVNNSSFSSDGAQITSSSRGGTVLLTPNPVFYYQKLKQNPPVITESNRTRYGLRPN